MVRNMTVQVFDSFESENKAEYARRAAMTPAERMAEFSVLQDRAFGVDWHKQKIEHKVSFEILDW